jgi:BirA family biotin operon repressor/biotin-[acetyl-CoA-carboxylase] ligase
MTDAQHILEKMSAASRASLDSLEWFAELESTSTWLSRQSSPLRGHFRAVIAEHQTGGRGRDGKVWLSPPCSGLCLSMAYTFLKTPANLPGLTLAIGVGMAEALKEIGARGIALKWPNDLVADDGKLGGILTEVHSDGQGGKAVVVGLGLNVDLPDSMRYAPPTSWTRKISDLAACMETVPDAAELAATAIATLIDSISGFEREGLGAFRSRWLAFDWLKGKTISVEQGQERVSGVADGIDEDGALLVKTGEGTARVVSGSVEVPPCGEACA